MMNSLLSFFRKGDSSFNQLEIEILNSVCSELSKGLSDKLKERISSINLVQRIDEDKEVNCFHMKSGKPCFGNGQQLIDASGEMIMADFTVKSTEEIILNGNIWLVDGFLFSIEFFESPKSFDLSTIREIEIKLADSFR
jgi:hypothetical protein